MMKKITLFALFIVTLLLTTASYAQGTITGPGTFTGTTVGAVNDCSVRSTEDYYYNITAWATGSYTFSLCGSSYDTYLYIRNGSACGTSTLTSNDDFCGTQSQVTVTLTAGTAYSVLIEGWSGSGAYTLNVTGPAVPPSAVLVPATGNNTVACGTNVTLQDNGGTGNYVDNSNGYTVLENTLGSSAVITLTGTYNTESSFDYVRIYRGVGTGGTLVGSYTGAGSIPTITSAAGEALTVQFTSDVSVTYPGFDFTVSYSGSCSPPTVLVPTTGNNTVACGTNVTLQDNGGTGNYVDNSNGYTVLENTLGSSAVITLTGTYSTESSFDYVRIYRGVGTGGTLVGSYTGSGSIPTITSAAGEALTVQFTSDVSVAYPGFDFNVSYSGSCAPPACSPPTGLTASGITTTTATVSWTASVSAPSGGYEWELRTSGAGGSGATGLAASGSVGAGVTSSSVTGLTASTTYSLYVRSNCGSGTYSVWAGPYNFTTNPYVATTNTFETLCSPYYNRSGGFSTQYYYDMYSFTVGVSGNYDIEAAWTLLSSSIDGYLYLYQNSFDPLNPATNLVTSNDDHPITGLAGSLISGVSLSTGTTYFIVATTFSGSAGATKYLQSGVITISGPSLAVVPTNADYYGNPIVILASGGLSSVATCDYSGWTYYTNNDGTGQYVFAINWDPSSIGGGHNSAAKAASVSGLSLGLEPTAYGDVNTTNEDGAFIMKRYWNVDLGGVTLDGPVDVRFYYDPAEVTEAETLRDATRLSSGYTPATHPDIPFTWFKSTGMAYSPVLINNGNNFSHFGVYRLSGTYAVEDGIDYVELTSIPSFSGGSGGAGFSPIGGTPLPVELVSIEAIPNVDAINVEWITSVEINNDKFDLERSIDGIHFEYIATIEGNGNSTEMNRYNYLDAKVDKNVEYYYRLKQIDFDGAYEYTQMVSAKLLSNSTSTFEVSVFPNPTNSVININLVGSNVNEVVEYQILDLMGHVVAKSSFDVNNGIGQIQIGEFASGSYILELNTNNTIYSKRFVKVD